MYGYIYKITNNINNKIYIGQTTRTVEKRVQEHFTRALYYTTKYDKDEYKYVHLYLAIKKYGAVAFTYEQIDAASTCEELNEKEDYWINFYNSIRAGYNMMPGGNDKNPMDSAIVKAKHDFIMRTEEVRNKISKTLSKKRLEEGFSEEHKQKIKESRARRKAERAAQGLGFYDHPENMASRNIGCYCILNTGERFDFKSIKDGGKWWYENYKPFGEVYSTATYQRKIEASIRGEEIIYGNKTHKKHTKITNIKWYNINKDKEQKEVVIYE
jgi:group I intron endonuclease